MASLKTKSPPACSRRPASGEGPLPITLRSNPAEKHLALPVRTTAPELEASSSFAESSSIMANENAFILPSSIASTVTSPFSPALRAVTSWPVLLSARRGARATPRATASRASIPQVSLL